MACHIVEGILLLIFLLHHTEGRVDCTDTEDCGIALVYHGCTEYPVSLQFRKNCPATCKVCNSTRHECNEGYIEMEGHCETCLNAVLGGLKVTDVSCPQCPDVTKHGKNCDFSCSTNCLNSCERWSGKCHGCKSNSVYYYGRYGIECDVTCPANCYNRTCQQDGGACSDGCDSGFFGSHCDKHCSANCLCENGEACSRPPCGEGGTCTHGCRQGFYGGDCSSPCPSGCRNNACSREGRCLACEEGWYGDQCQLPCSATCRQKQCQQSTGFCTHGCQAGFWGEACNSPCPDTCVTCSAASQCFLCKDGWYGEACQRPCHDHCHGGCNHLGVCHQCADGFYGSECNHLCKTCASSGRGAPVCSRDSGRCSQGCKNGFFGPRCEAPCSQRCLESTCTGLFPEQGGNCTKGCQDGYRGLYCQVPCPARCQTCSQLQVGCGQCQEGWYGQVCEERCRDCTGACHKDTGLCLQTCTGPQCDKGEVQTGNLQYKFIFALSFLGGAFLLFVIVAILMGVYCYRRIRKLRRDGGRNPMVRPTTSHLYDSLDMGDGYEVPIRLSGRGNWDFENYTDMDNVLPGLEQH